MNRSFYDIVQKWQDFNFDNFFDNLTDSEILSILDKENLSESDFLKLLSPISDKYIEKLAVKANKKTIAEFGKTVQIYAPIYLSNYCNNNCIYCGFNSSNTISRSKLSMDELKNECNILKDNGIRHILLLTGGDRIKTPPKYILECVRIALAYFDSVSIEIYSLTTMEYREFFNAGVHNLTLYQETYNKDLYETLHLAGEKRDYKFRLNAPQRAGEAMFRSLNIGALLGLNRPLIDFFLSALHCKYLFDNFPSTEISISLPRIKESVGGFNSKYIVSDKDYVKFLTVFRLFLPKCGISISTRESKEFRDNLLGLGVTKMSAGSKTEVGGYSNSKSDEQFKISDNRTIEEVDLSIRNLGYQPVYKDWVYI